MALQMRSWGGKVVTMEMDPVNAAIARNNIELAGLSDAVRVQLGHSDDCLELVLEQHGQGSVDMAFMDQRGTRFHADLQRLEQINLLADGAVVCADNVLKPGAPYHVWRICSLPHYRTDIVDLREFGSAQVEDWMTISWTYKGVSSYGGEPESRRDLVALAREADRFRLRAMATSMKDIVGGPLDEFAGRFAEEFCRLGMSPTIYVHTELDPDVEGGAVSRLVPLARGEVAPKWDGKEHRDSLVGGRWRSVIGHGQVFTVDRLPPIPLVSAGTRGGTAAAVNGAGQHWYR
eukprot:gnl/TRDRNA2_/TRDRNA2_82407_c1_seq1.p1 gnl/TRDRNA2_/TRDRNA2_82407_c1~~gnl/TRDRNA2_/TRDRNA2_82407_c1_seq1.p1  ORF type:complete len:298 (-),score=52.75 gnl/TRDRNA2_/TRDRNA2_82407_c1_seq1:29-898(-)